MMCRVHMIELEKLADLAMAIWGSCRKQPNNVEEKNTLMRLKAKGTTVVSLAARAAAATEKLEGECKRDQILEKLRSSEIKEATA